jgi:predicted metal-dependent hydrolase
MKRAISSIIWSTVSSERSLAGAPLRLLVSPRARRMRLKVDPRTRSVVLTVPRRVSERRALAWAAGQSEWVAGALAAIPEALPIAPGSLLPLGGVPHRIDWDPGRPRRIELEPGRLLAGGPAEGLEARLLRWLRGRAQELLEQETRDYAAKAGVAASRVRVGDPVSRWGSCSSSGAIRYSWRLVFAPEFVRRATVAHEVAHLFHMNHGPDFHLLVRTLLGADPKPARSWLRREGGALHRIGRKP